MQESDQLEILDLVARTSLLDDDELMERLNHLDEAIKDNIKQDKVMLIVLLQLG